MSAAWGKRRRPFPGREQDGVIFDDLRFKFAKEIG
jgi:hypothetical protein